MKIRNAFVLALAVTAAVTVTGCGHLMMMMHGRNVARPAATEFGTGPRASASRQFTATLQPDQPLRPRRMQTVRVAITDAAGAPVDNATIQIDGGMPAAWPRAADAAARDARARQRTLRDRRRALQHGRLVGVQARHQRTLRLRRRHLQPGAVGGRHDDDEQGSCSRSRCCWWSRWCRPRRRAESDGPTKKWRN